MANRLTVTYTAVVQIAIRTTMHCADRREEREQKFVDVTIGGNISDLGPQAGVASAG